MPMDSQVFWLLSFLGIRMKRLLFAVALLLLSMTLHAGTLNIGIEGGYTIGFYDYRGAVRNGTNFKLGHAFEIAVPLEYRFNDIVGISSGIRYIGKSYGRENILNNETVFDLRNVEHFFEIPLTLRVSADFGIWRLFAGAGGYIGIRFLSTEMGATGIPMVGTSWNVIPYDADNDNLFDAGIIAEAGFGYSFNGRGELQIIARYQYSLTDLDKNYQEEHIERYIDTLSITAGYSFCIGGNE